MKFQNRSFAKTFQNIFITDISDYRILKPVSTHQNKTKPIFIQIFYRDRGIDLIHLRNTLHNKKVQSFIDCTIF